MSVWMRTALVGVIAILWFSAVQPWGSFRDPDAFYHAKMAALMIEQRGPIHAFPWLDLTTLGKHFADQHFLFHVALIPFVKFFGTLPGAQIAAVCFAALFIVVFYLVLRRLKIVAPEFWTLLVMTSGMMVLRLSLAKASPLAIAWFVVGMYVIARRKPWIGFIAGLGFALTHGGWIILLGSQGLFLIGDVLFERGILSKDWRTTLRAVAWRPLVSTCIGAAAGMLVHPNFPETLSFLWVQVVKIGLGTPFNRVTLGTEWLPVTAGELLIAIAPLAIAFLITAYGLLFARKPSLDLARARDAIAFGMPVAALLALTLKSQRTAEYLIPALVLWIATLATLIDLDTFWKELRSKAMVYCVGSLLVGTIVVGSWNAFHSLSTLSRPFNLFAQPMAALAPYTQPGDRVCNTDWDEFPELFNLNDRLRYVSGLDPTFLLDANPTLSDTYQEITLGHVTSGAAEIMQQQFGCRFVFLDRERHVTLEKNLVGEPVGLLYQDDRVAVYQLHTHEEHLGNHPNVE